MSDNDGTPAAPADDAGRDDETGRPEASEVPYDPTGLDLARQIADSVAHAAPLPAPKVRKKRRGPGPTRGSKGDPMPVGEALDGLIKRQGWTTDLSVHSLLGRWPALVGTAVAEHSKPEGFSGGVITVRTDSTAWASQLRLMAPQLVAKLNEKLGQGTITRIEVKGPDAPTWKHGLRSVRDGRGPRDTYG